MSRLTVGLVGLLLVATVAAGAHGVAAQERVTLTVSVVSNGGDPVADAALDASWDGGSTTETTAGNGKAFVDVPAGANVTIEVDHPDFVRNDPYTIVDASEGDVEITVYRKGSLAVSASDSEGPVADAGVIVRKNGHIVSHGRTDDAGDYGTGVIEVGTYSVEVVKRGYYRTVEEVAVDGDVSRSISIERGSVVLEFDVSDPHFSPARDVTAAEITIDGVGTFNTLENGEASARVPVNAVLRLSVTKDAYETVEREIRVDESGTEVSVNLSRSPMINLSATSRRVVAGERLAVEVTDEYGDEVEGATVLLDGAAAGTTNGDGEFAVRISEPGNHTLEATKGGLTSETYAVEAVEPAADTTATTTEATEETTTDAATTTSTTESGGMAGFTVAVALVALALAALVAVRRR